MWEVSLPATVWEKVAVLRIGDSGISERRRLYSLLDEYSIVVGYFLVDVPDRVRHFLNRGRIGESA